jgi:hypothetical protein
MNSALPVWLAPDAASVLAIPRPLAEMARPARGHDSMHTVLFSIVPLDEACPAAAELTDIVAVCAGPTRCGPIVVEVAFTHEAAASRLRSPVTRLVPAGRLNAVLAVFSNVREPSVLLMGFCRVLWPQPSGRVGAS